MISALVIGDADIRDALAALPDAARQSLGRAVLTLSIALQRRAAELCPGGPGGRLGRSIVADLSQDGDRLVATVSSDLPYAGFQEYGFHGTEAVRTQLRMIRKAFGRPIAPRRIAVRAYDRRVDYAGHSFLRAALIELEPEIREGLRAGLRDALDAATGGGTP
jgi:hypothetical protein